MDFKLTEEQMQLQKHVQSFGSADLPVDTVEFKHDAHRSDHALITQFDEGQ